MTDPNEHSTSFLVPAAAAMGPLLVAILLLVGSDRLAVTAFLLLLEPLLGAFALFAVLQLMVRRRWNSAFLLSVTSVIAILALHAPPREIPPSALDLPWADQMGRCAAQLDSPQGPLRVLTWRMEGLAPEVDPLKAMLAMRPDIVVLTGMEDGTLMDRLMEEAGGEVRRKGDDESHLGIWARGAFQLCGTEGALDWDLAPSDSAMWSASLAFPDITGVGVVPIVAFDLPLDPSVQRRATARLAAAGRLLGNQVVVLGHLGAPTTWRSVAGRLKGAGLHDMGGPPTWPSQVFHLPFLPFQRLDRVLTGSFWTTDAQEGLPSPSPWRPLLVQLQAASQSAVR